MLKVYISLLLFAISLSSSGQGYDIKISVQGASDTVAYLGHHFGSQRYLNDTSSVVNGVAHFTGDEALPEGIYFYYSPNTYFEFVIGNQEFSLSTAAPDYIRNLEVTGSPENDIFHELQMVTLENQGTLKSLQNELGTAPDDEARQEIRSKLQEASAKFKQERLEVAQKYPDSYVARFIRALSVPTWAEFKPDLEPETRYREYKEHYFDGIDLADDGLLRSPAYHSLINEYMDKVTIQNPDSIIASADFILRNVEENPVVFRYALVTLTQKYETSEVMGMDKVFVHLAEEYYLTGKADWIDEEVEGKIRERVEALKPNLIGSAAPSLSLADTSLREVKFQNIDSDYMVLYFYDPDCGHCKTKTPILHEAYQNTLKDGNVEVLGICIAGDVEKWKGYVKENDLSWVNVIDTRGSRRAYDIRSTPTIYILDRDKNIVAKRISADDVTKVIEMLRERES